MPRSSPQTLRLISIVRLLASSPDETFRLSDIARRLHLDKATALPMLSALVEAGWLARRPDTKEYTLGPALVGIGAAAARRFPGSGEIRSALLALAERWGLSFLAFTEDGGYATLLDNVWDVRATLHSVPPLSIGQRVPIRPPFGAVFAAYGGPGASDRWLAEVPEAQRESYRLGLERFREQSFSVELRTVTADVIPTELDESDQLLAEIINTAVTEPGILTPPLHANVDYPVATAVAPVLRPDGSVAVALVATGFADLISGTRLLEIRDDMVRRAGAVADALRAQELPLPGTAYGSSAS